MQFGHLPPEELDVIDFTLPTNSVFTNKTLASAGKGHTPLVYVGCAKWGRKEWVGQIYPPKTKEANFLDHYVKHFNSIELNATHYQVYPPSTISKWGEKAGTMDFKFCPKVPQAISHYTNLVTDKAQQLTDKFLEGIMAFQEHLGPVFLQLSDKFSPKTKENLYQYLKSLPTDIQVFAEVRHAEWYADKTIRKNLLETLQSNNTGLVITDTAGRRDCVHMELTIPKAFVRFVGNDLHPTDYARIDAWMPRINSWLESGLKELYFFMHQPDEKYSPELCNYLVEQMNKHCKTELVLPLKSEE